MAGSSLEGESAITIEKLRRDPHGHLLASWDRHEYCRLCMDKYHGGRCFREKPCPVCRGWTEEEWRVVAKADATAAAKRARRERARKVVPAPAPRLATERSSPVRSTPARRESSRDVSPVTAGLLDPRLARTASPVKRSRVTRPVGHQSLRDYGRTPATVVATSTVPAGTVQATHGLQSSMGSTALRSVTVPSLVTVSSSSVTVPAGSRPSRQEAVLPVTRAVTAVSQTAVPAPAKPVKSFRPQLIDFEPCRTTGRRSPAPVQPVPPATAPVDAGNVITPAILQQAISQAMQLTEDRLLKRFQHLESLQHPVLPAPEVPTPVTASLPSRPSPSPLPSEPVSTDSDRYGRRSRKKKKRKRRKRSRLADSDRSRSRSPRDRSSDLAERSTRRGRSSSPELRLSVDRSLSSLDSDPPVRSTVHKITEDRPSVGDGVRERPRSRSRSPLARGDLRRLISAKRSPIRFPVAEEIPRTIRLVRQGEEVERVEHAPTLDPPVPAVVSLDRAGPSPVVVPSPAGECVPRLADIQPGRVHVPAGSLSQSVDGAPAVAQPPQSLLALSAGGDGDLARDIVPPRPGELISLQSNISWRESRAASSPTRPLSSMPSEAEELESDEGEEEHGRSRYSRLGGERRFSPVRPGLFPEPTRLPMPTPDPSVVLERPTVSAVPAPSSTGQPPLESPESILAELRAAVPDLPSARSSSADPGVDAPAGDNNVFRSNLDFILADFRARGYGSPHKREATEAPRLMSQPRGKEAPPPSCIPFSQFIPQQMDEFSRLLAGEAESGENIQFHQGDHLNPPKNLPKALQVPARTWNYKPRAASAELTQFRPGVKARLPVTLTSSNFDKLIKDLRYLLVALSAADVEASSVTSLLRRLAASDVPPAVASLLDLLVSLEQSRARSLQFALTSAVRLDVNMLLTQREAVLSTLGLDQRLAEALYTSPVRPGEHFLFDQETLRGVIQEVHQQLAHKAQLAAVRVTEIASKHQAQKAPGGSGGGGGGTRRRNRNKRRKEKKKQKQNEGKGGRGGGKGGRGGGGNSGRKPFPPRGRGRNN